MAVLSAFIPLILVFVIVSSPLLFHATLAAVQAIGKLPMFRPATERA